MNTTEANNAYYFYGIPGLLVPKSGRSIAFFERLDNFINKYIDAIPALTESIERNFANISVAARREYFIKNMELVISLLHDVYARWLEQDARIILNSTKSDDKMEVAYKKIEGFISDLITLSINMQNAQQSTEGVKKEKLSPAEAHFDAASNLAQIVRLIDDGESMVVLKIIKSVVGSGLDNAIDRHVVDLIMESKFDDAKKIALDLIESHKLAIEALSTDNTSKKILAVDDRPEILQFITSALKDNYKVFAATSGEAALKIADAHKPDLFILDIDMPEMDGFELADKFRADSNHMNTPIIFLTGNSSREYVRKALRIGCKDFIVKPTSRNYLLAKATKFIGKK